MAEVSCWIFTGERQSVVLRSKYVQVLLRQEIAFFDTLGKSEEVVDQITNDTLLLQYAIGEKVGHTQHSLAGRNRSMILCHELLDRPPFEMCLHHCYVAFFVGSMNFKASTYSDVLLTQV